MENAFVRGSEDVVQAFALPNNKALRNSGLDLYVIILLICFFSISNSAIHIPKQIRRHRTLVRMSGFEMGMS